MKRFWEYIENDKVELDRDDLYFYSENGDYAILDIKNEKLYYLNSYIYTSRTENSEYLGISVKEYVEKEIYDVRGGMQNDGRDYYVYKFSTEQGNIILDKLKTNSKWTTEKIPEEKITEFEYNEEVKSIEHAYYYYNLICRTSDTYKKEHFTEEEATGFELGIYDIDNNIFYYCWESI